MWDGVGMEWEVVGVVDFHLWREHLKHQHLPNFFPPATTQAPTVPPVYLAGYLDCNFEGNNLCLWSQVPDGAGDDFDWDLTTGSSDSVGTGPPADHTKQNQEGMS